MGADKEGFWYPQVDTAKCVECGRCETACPILCPVAKNQQNTVAYAAYNKDEAIRLQSSSGGLFTLLASEIIRQGGVVFGAAYNERFEVEHICVESVEELERLRGSKYAQSRIGNSYSEVKRMLDSGRKVLFTGTPCQIGGLVSYLGKTYDNLYTQDIICHGVPSPMVWQRYVKFREKKSASLTRRTFSRHKNYGWKMFSVLFEFSNNTEYIQAHSTDLYMRSFLRNFSLRPSCYHCHFKGIERYANITLADFWGIQNVAPEMDDDKGTSLVLIHSKKGEELFGSVADSICYKTVDADEAIKYNSSAIASVARPKRRDSFMKAVWTQDFEKTVKRYTEEKSLKSALSDMRYLPQRTLRKALGDKTAEKIKQKLGR